MNARDLEHAESCVALERDALIRRNANRMAETGTAHCVDCEDPIPKERKQAAPFAKRCLGCAQLLEQRGKQYAS